MHLMTMRPDHLSNDAWYSDEACAKLEDDNPLLLEKVLTEANRQRVKTPEQLAREFTELKRIESELAKQRQGKQEIHANYCELHGLRNVVPFPRVSDYLEAPAQGRARRRT